MMILANNNNIRMMRLINWILIMIFLALIDLLKIRTLLKSNQIWFLKKGKIKWKILIIMKDLKTTIKNKNLNKAIN